MWIRVNPNPAKKEVSDCVIRAISIALNMPWLQVFDELNAVARMDFNMPSDNRVWGHYLYLKGFQPFLLPQSCPDCVTVKEFARIFNQGTYIIGTGSHAVAIIHGDYFDSWDSGNEVPSYFWKINR